MGIGTLNLYLYAHGNPLFWVDPTGNEDIPWLEKKLYQAERFAGIAISLSPVGLIGKTAVDASVGDTRGAAQSVASANPIIAPIAVPIVAGIAKATETGSTKTDVAIAVVKAADPTPITPILEGGEALSRGDKTTALIKLGQATLVGVSLYFGIKGAFKPRGASAGSGAKASGATAPTPKAATAPAPRKIDAAVEQIAKEPLPPGQTAPTAHTPTLKAFPAPPPNVGVIPIEGRVNVGGGMETQKGWTNLQPYEPNTGGPATGVPNAVPGYAQDIGTIFAKGSIKEMTSSKLPVWKFTPESLRKFAEGSHKAMAEGGTFKLHFHAADLKFNQEVQSAFKTAGFKDVTIDAHGFITGRR
jgi:hypothetical protein